MEVCPSRVLGRLVEDENMKDVDPALSPLINDNPDACWDHFQQCSVFGRGTAEEPRLGASGRLEERALVVTDAFEVPSERACTL
jgi:hypothetical protein